MQKKKFLKVKTTSYSIISVAFAIYIFLFTYSCTPYPYPPTNQEELITTANLYLLDSVGDTLFWQFRDLDGEGGEDPNIIWTSLDTQSEYQVYIELYNESVIPVADISEEVEEESADHQFFYQTDVPSISFQYEDQDPNGHPLGEHFRIKSTYADSGNIEIVLRHQPDKSAPGVSSGQISNAGGETDLQIQFPLIIK